MEVLIQEVPVSDTAVAASRWRLLSLWISQVAHFAGTYALRVFAALRVGSEGVVSSGSAWHLVTALFMLPAVFLAPFYGAAGNSLPKASVLRRSALFGLAVAAYFTWLNHGWLACVVLAALGSASYAPTRLAMLPAAAHESRIPLNTVVGIIETGSVLAIVGGMIVGGVLVDRNVGANGQIAAAMLWVTGCFAICLIASGPACFATDVRRPEPVLSALRSFFRDVADFFRNPATRRSLLAIAYLRGVVTAGAGAFIAVSLRESSTPPITVMMTIAMVTMGGTGLGCFLASMARDPRRSLGLIPIGAVGLTACLAAVAAYDSIPLYLCFCVGCCAGLINVPLLAAFQRSLAPATRGNAMALLNTAGYLAMTLSSLLFAGLAQSGLVTPRGQFWCVTALAAAGAAVSLVLLNRAPEPP